MKTVIVMPKTIAITSYEARQSIAAHLDDGFLREVRNDEADKVVIPTPIF